METGAVNVCPVCYWQTGGDPQSRHNLTALFRAQEHFSLFLASHEKWIDHVRRPRNDEERLPDWKLSDPVPEIWTARDAAIATIQSAFANVSRAGGVSIREADVIDSRGSKDARMNARASDMDVSWDQVIDSDMDQFQSALSFFDPIGFRYYLPAYMVRDLREFRGLGGSARSRLIFHLGKIAENVDDRAMTLTLTQGKAVLAYLRFFADYGDAYDSVGSVDAISRFWNVYMGMP